jgi:hypothetical protein
MSNDQWISLVMIAWLVGYGMAIFVEYCFRSHFAKKRKRKYLPAERMFSHALVDAAEEYVSQLKHYNDGAIDRDYHVGPHMARAWKDLSDAAVAHAEYREVP